MTGKKQWVNKAFKTDKGEPQPTLESPCCRTMIASTASRAIPRDQPRATRIIFQLRRSSYLVKVQTQA